MSLSWRAFAFLGGLILGSAYGLAFGAWSSRVPCDPITLPAVGTVCVERVAR